MIMMMLMIMKSRRKEVDEDDKKKGGHEKVETRLKESQPTCSLPADDHAALCLQVSTRGGQRLPN